MTLHELKKRQARKMLTPAEKKSHCPIFLSEAWNLHKEAIQRKVKKQQAEAHKRALLRKE
jgi:hypothetical protein